jgi:hypothetical protein
MAGCIYIRHLFHGDFSSVGRVQGSLLPLRSVVRSHQVSRSVHLRTVNFHKQLVVRRVFLHPPPFIHHRKNNHHDRGNHPHCGSKTKTTESRVQEGLADQPGHPVRTRCDTDIGLRPGKSRDKPACDQATTKRRIMRYHPALVSTGASSMSPQTITI